MAFDVVTYGLCKSYVNRYISSAAPTTFPELRNASRAGTVENYFAVGDQFVVPHTTLGDLTFDLIGIGQDTPADASYATNFPSGKPLTLQLHDCLAARQFNQAQANYKILVAIAAGAWCIKLQHPDYAGGVDTYYDFTSDVEMGVGGLLRMTDATHVAYFAPTKNTLESPTKSYELTAAEVHTKLTVSPTEGAQLSAQNNSNRVKSGSNRWLYSSLRQWLSSSAAAGAWWAQYTGDLYSLAPSTPTYATDAGFLNGMDADFLAVVGNVTKTVTKDAVDGGGTESLTEQFYLPNLAEVHGAGSTTAYTYYSANGVATSANVPWRIKYLSAVAKYWWLRDAGSTSANVTKVTVLGAIDNVGPVNTTVYCPAPCCVIW